MNQRLKGSASFRQNILVRSATGSTPVPTVIRRASPGTGTKISSVRGKKIMTSEGLARSSQGTF